MNKKILYFIVYTLFSINLFAQNIQYLGGVTVSGYGNGSSNISSTTFNIPPGKNRIVLVTFNIERQHSGNNGSNHILSTFSQDPNNAYFGLKIGNIDALRGTTASKYTSVSSSLSANAASITNYYQSYFLTDLEGLPTGNTTFDWSSIKAPENVADEIIVNISVFENVKQYYPLLPSWNNAPLGSIIATTVNSISSANFSLTKSVPIGRSFSERLFFGNGYVSDSYTNFTSNWTAIDSKVVVNNMGSSSNLANTQTEPGGITSRFDMITNVTSNPIYTVTRNSTTPIGYFLSLVLLLEPLAKPSLSGTIFHDTDGNASINGYGTNNAAQYVNIIDAETNKVVYVCNVLANGSYSVPIGELVENYDYKIQISKLSGVVGSQPPAIELNTNWTIVGESINATGNDGNPDGTINFKMGDSNLVNYNFGVINIIDTDGDGIPDYLDLDDDNDGILDTEEGYNCFEAPNLSALNPNSTSFNWISNSIINPHSILIQTTGNVFRKWVTNGIIGLEPAYGEKITYTFSSPVSNLHLSFLDLDSSEVININLYDELGNRIPNILTSGITIDNTHSTGTYPTITQNSTYGLIISAPYLGVYDSNLNYVDLITNNIKITKAEFTFTGNVNTPEYQILGYCLDKDTDSDTIPDHLDTDSDNDGCADAMEGSELISSDQIHSLNLPSTDPNYAYRGQIKVTYDGTSVNTPVNIISTSALGYGVPQLVNNAGNNLHLITNPSNLKGVADATDLTADVGQSSGSAYDNLIQSTACKICYKPAETTGVILNTNVGISTLEKDNNWPENRKGAFLAIESKTKGFVLPRTIPSSITTPELGMLIYDTSVNCIKMYTLNSLGLLGWYCIEKQTCDEPI